MSPPIRNLVDEFCKTDTYRQWTSHNQVSPADINSGLCGEFAEFVLKRYDGDLERMTTADTVGVPEAARPEPWHVWVTDGTLHYDAQHPDGVSSWQSLDYFRKYL